MEAVVSILTRRRSGSVARRDHEVTCEALRFGRSPESDVRLTDPRIATNQATLFERDGGFVFEGTAAGFYQIDEVETRSGTVKVGSVLRVGPYEVKLVEPPQDVDLALTVELVEPLGEALDQLKSVSRTSLNQTNARRRTWAWGLSLIVLAVFFIWPLASFFTDARHEKIPNSPMQAAAMEHRVWPIAADLSWDTGQMSGPHKFLADNCTTCHQKPFAAVSDAVCTACHADVRHHVDPKKYKYPELTTALCQSCHKEHQGAAPITLKDQAFCADCHGSLAEKQPQAKIGDATDFRRNHPEFRPTVVTDATKGTVQRIVLNPKAWPKENSNLRFSHKAHLKPGGVKNPQRPDREVLTCANCHKPVGSGISFAPIQMERDCNRCHRLQFDPTRPKRVVPHGNAELVMESVTDFYRAYALEGGYLNKPEELTSRRRPGGVELTKEQRMQALQWASVRTEQAADYLFGKSVCGTCHFVAPGANGKPGRRVAKVNISERWLPKGLFDHASHLNTACVTCHEAETSEVATDVLLPQVGTCQACHGGEQSRDLVPSTCVMCHEFHQPDLGIMRPNLVRAKMPAGK